MKLLNYTTSYFSLILLVIISIWAGLFYYAMLDEIRDSIDDGLDNQKGLIIRKVVSDTSLLYNSDFEEGGYMIREVPRGEAISLHDTYVDTMMYMENEQGLEPVRFLKTAFKHSDKYFQLQVFTSMVEEDDLSAELLYSLLWLYAGLLITILLVNKYLLQKIWNPFYKTLRHLKAFRLENPQQVPDVTTKVDEFSLLNNTIKKFIQRSIDSFNNQKEFIENAAHELQTPIAITINKLEELAAKPSLTEADSKLLLSALDNLNRLTRLNKSLLLLSKISNHQFHGQASLNVTSIIKKIIEDFDDLLNFKNINVSIDETETCQINMHEDLATILFTNLIKNAVVHNISGGKIDIRISKKEFIISNTSATGLLDQEKLYSRFYKSQPSESSTGLGLSIVKEIINLSHYKISYNYQAGIHSFRIEFT